MVIISEAQPKKDQANLFVAASGIIARPEKVLCCPHHSPRHKQSRRMHIMGGCVAFSAFANSWLNEVWNDWYQAALMPTVTHFMCESIWKG
jgi:hypothetical protein